MMFDWLNNAFTDAAELAPQDVVIRLVCAAICGSLVAAVGYQAHGRRKPDGHILISTLVLLTILLAMVTLVIGNSIARAFGLVGALSIVRFRTVVDDTRDTAFVIFAVVVGMAIGAGSVIVPAVGIPLVAAVAIGMDRWRSDTPPQGATHKLTVRLGLGRDPAAICGQVFQNRILRSTILSAQTAKQGSALEVTYLLTLAEPDSDTIPIRLVAELNQTEGIQTVDLNRL